MKIENLIRKNIKALKPYHAARHDANLQGIFLDANENPYNNGYNRYPDPYQNELKAAISKLNNVRTDQIFVGNGSDETLDLLIRAFCEPNIDNVIIMPPTYGMYTVLGNINAVTCVEVPLNKDFSLDAKRVLSAVDAHTKIIFICSPNNPTGNLLSKDEINLVLQKFNGIVVVDEAYIDFSYSESAIELLNRFPNLFVNQTLSKAYSGAGLRLGMGFSSSEIIQVLNTIKPPYNINLPAQLIGIELLQKQSDLNLNIQLIRTEKARLYTAFKEFAFVKEVFPSDANFWLVRFDNATRIHQVLLNLGIVTRNRSHELYCENTLRISIGTRQENNKLINCLTQIKTEK
ncbi:MAG: histidinol-phosphate aminotransferase [Crocinitomix sp.]|jgi:histidinol-phosphate aminotransferase